MSIDIFSTRTMLKAVKIMPKTQTFLRDTFFSTHNMFETENIDIDIMKGKRKMAPFVNPRLPGKTLVRDGYETYTYKPCLLNPNTVTTADTIMKRQPGEAIYGGMSPIERGTQILANDLTMLDEAITRREEWMCAQLLLTGKVIMIGEGVKDELDFKFTNTETLPPAKQWNKADADPITDIKKWREKIQKASGINPTTLILSSDVATAFMNNEKIQKQMNIWNLQNITMAPKDLAGGVTYVCRIAELGIDVYYYNEWYADDSDGEVKSLLPPGTAILLSKNDNYALNYGAVALVDKGMFVSERVPSSWTTPDPSARFLNMMSRPLPICKDVDGWFSAKVL